ncbi:hypothetical protein X777_01568 [Ooceraea biroi]|uniref:Uncharacterized protein n=1 Tax=Ooceraea biroi TaxID=2015173 RepID=A0A026WSY1_OOCBI|nr:hypothetical protein X777_01568 [Ooceraea biroi]
MPLRHRCQIFDPRLRNDLPVERVLDNDQLRDWLVHSIRADRALEALKVECAVFVIGQGAKTHPGQLRRASLLVKKHVRLFSTVGLATAYITMIHD